MERDLVAIPEDLAKSKNIPEIAIEGIFF